MAQAGIHGMVGMAVRKWTPDKTWLMLGIVLGSISPDLDNILVAVATVTKESTEGLHRTFTHSFITAALVVLVFYLIGRFTSKPRWTNLGLGLGIGIVMHSLLDLLIWFNGVALLWPFPLWVNFWENVPPPELWMKLMEPAELLFMALFFYMLGATARKRNTDAGYLKTLNIWTGIEAVLFVVFTVLAFTMGKGFLTIFGVVYLLSLLLAAGVTIRMRQTVEAI